MIIRNLSIIKVLVLELLVKLEIIIIIIIKCVHLHYINTINLKDQLINNHLYNKVVNYNNNNNNNHHHQIILKLANLNLHHNSNSSSNSSNSNNNNRINNNNCNNHKVLQKIDQRKIHNLFNNLVFMAIKLEIMKKN